MNRTIIVVTLLLAGAASVLVAAPIQLISGLPSSYTPGQPVAFNVVLPPLANLGAYNIDLALEGSVGAAGVHFYFDEAATLPAASQYVFPSAVNYFDSVTLDTSTRQRITLSDFDFTGVNVATGVNDRVATVVFRTDANYTSPLSVVVDINGLILDTPAVAPTPIAGFAQLSADIAAAGPLNIPSVPEPNIGTLFAAAVLLARSARWRFHCEQIKQR